MWVVLTHSFSHEFHSLYGDRQHLHSVLPFELTCVNSGREILSEDWLPADCISHTIYLLKLFSCVNYLIV